MSLFLKFMEHLKQEEIYDRALILLVADTGGVGLPSGYVPENDPTPQGWRELVGSANPILLVKAPGARGPLRKLAAGVQPSDIAATVCAIVAACAAAQGTSVFEAGAASPRTRRYHHYRFPRKYWGRNQIPGIVRYDVRGPIWELRSWTNLEAAGAAE